MLQRCVRACACCLHVFTCQSKTSSYLCSYTPLTMCTAINNARSDLGACMQENAGPASSEAPCFILKGLCQPPFRPNLSSSYSSICCLVYISWGAMHSERLKTSPANFLEPLLGLLLELCDNLAARIEYGTAVLVH